MELYFLWVKDKVEKLFLLAKTLETNIKPQIFMPFKPLDQGILQWIVIWLKWQLSLMRQVILETQTCLSIALAGIKENKNWLKTFFGLWIFHVQETGWRSCSAPKTGIVTTFGCSQSLYCKKIISQRMEQKVMKNKSTKLDNELSRKSKNTRISVHQ